MWNRKNLENFADLLLFCKKKYLFRRTFYNPAPTNWGEGGTKRFLYLNIAQSILEFSRFSSHINFVKSVFLRHLKFISRMLVQHSRMCSFLESKNDAFFRFEFCFFMVRIEIWIQFSNQKWLIHFFDSNSDSNRKYEIKQYFESKSWLKKPWYLVKSFFIFCMSL